MATPSAQLDRTTLQDQVVGIVRELLVELGSHRALDDLSPRAHLEKDLGLGSLERVELISRLASTFQVPLPDRIVAEVDTVSDLIAAVIAPDNCTGPHETASSRASATLEKFAGGSSAAAHAGDLPEARTLLDVIRHRGTADASRPHMFLLDAPSANSPRSTSPAPLRSSAAQPGHAPEADGATQVITFGTLYARAQAIARGLRARGLQPGQGVALMLPTSAEFFESFLGVLLAGGFAVPIYPPMRADRIEEYAARQSAILRSSEAHFLITFRQAEAVAHLLQPHVPSLKGVVTAAKLAATTNGPAEVAHEARARDIAFLQYTSGSTGEPKGVVLTHANVLANMRSIIRSLEFQPQDVAVTWLPLYHDMGLIGTWLTPFYFGLPVAAMSPLAFLTRPERWLWAVHQHKGTLSAAPNFAFELCVRKIQDRDIEGLDLSSWRAVLNGAEPVNAATLDRFCERFAKYGFRPEALLPVYGLAEATLAVTIPALNSEAQELSGRGPRVDRIDRAAFEDARLSPTGRARAVPAAPDDPAPLEFVSVGSAIPGFEVRIADENGHDAGERIEGSLWFRGAAATQGYFRDPLATQALQKGDGWIDSGDRAYQAGGEFFITGRVKDIIIKAGRNIYPHEVEEAASSVEGVRRGCVVAFGIADPQAGTERLVVVAETRGGLDPSARARIESAITERVTDAIGIPPDVVELVPPQSIPKTSSGKLRRGETKKLYLAGKLSSGKPPAWVQVARLAASSGARATKSVLRRAFELVYGLWSAVAFAIFLLPTWTLAYFAPTKAIACRVTQIGTRIFFRLILVPIYERGWENIQPGKPYVFVSNHTSFFDVLLYLALFKFPYRFVSKLEVAHWPFIGTFIRRREDFAFDRGDRNARLEQANALESSLREGVSLLIYPEGTFVASAGVRSFQLGAFKAAIATGCPVVPIALRGVREILRDETTFPRPGSIHFTIFPPIEPNLNAPPFQEMIRLRDVSRTLIAQHSGEHLL